MKEAILSKISQEDIFQRYFPSEISLNKRYTNPLRVEDDSPGCFFKYLGDKLYFIDFADNPTCRDCFAFLKDINHHTSFYDVLTEISKDFNLNLHKVETLFETPVITSIPKIQNKIIKPKTQEKETIIKVVVQAFTSEDLDYWNSYGITLKTLHVYNVRPAYRAWINELFYHQYSKKDPMYRYRENDTFKLYRPFASKNYVWRSNMRGGTLEGWNQLPDKGEVLVITKSTKDAMCLYELGISAVSVRSESTRISENAIALLEARFKKIYIWFDNDQAGIVNAQKLQEQTNWNNIVLPENEPKDPSDFIKKYDKLSLLTFTSNIF